MKKLILSSVVLLAVAACSGTSNNDGGMGGGAGGGGAGGGGGVTSFDVSGHAVVYPAAQRFTSDGGFTLVGLTARVEEPFKVATNSGGIFSVTTLDSTAAFGATGLSPDDIVLGVGAGIFDDGGTRVIRSATTIYDVALNDGNKPAANITNAKGYAIPTPFHDALVAAITPAKIQMLTSANGSVSTLVEAGCMIGRVIDAQGNPLSGVTVQPSSYASSFFYPTDDLGSTGTATGADGLFVYVHNGGAVAQFTLKIAGHTEYKTRNAGATAGACLVLDVFPGTTPP
ncbi:MAG: hypothetical protein QM723_24640 [Myxococcaceae bacterium]